MLGRVNKILYRLLLLLLRLGLLLLGGLLLTLWGSLSSTTCSVDKLSANDEGKQAAHVWLKACQLNCWVCGTVADMAKQHAPIIEQKFVQHVCSVCFFWLSVHAVQMSNHELHRVSQQTHCSAYVQ